MVQEAVAVDEVQPGDTIKIAVDGPANWYKVGQVRDQDSKKAIVVEGHKGFITLRSPYYQVRR